MIRHINIDDRNEYLKMVKTFYSSEAVSHTIPDEYILNTFDLIIKDNTYGDIFFCIDDEDNICGYMLVAYTYSQEAGGITMWIEEIFVKERYQHHGCGREFFNYVRDVLVKDMDIKRLRLEVTSDNDFAQSWYKSREFKEIEYVNMLKEI